MALKNCARCQSLFSGLREICEKCHLADEKLYFKVRRYLGENPGASASQIAEHTGVPIPEILKLIRKGSVQPENG